MRFHVSAWNINGLGRNPNTAEKVFNHDFINNI